jgi:hypothetical protein
VDPYMELPFYGARIWTGLGDEEEAVDRLHTFMSGLSRRGGGESADWSLHHHKARSGIDLGLCR